MPYKSDKQRAYLHAQKPAVAARFDKEIRAKKTAKKAASRKKK